MYKHPAHRTFELSPLNRNGLRERREKVCIYAAGLGREEAPLDDPEWDAWALNLICPMDSERRLRADLFWEIHAKHAQTEDDMEWIRANPIPYIVDPSLEGIPGSEHRVVPYRKMLEKFPGAPFACTFCYQLAYALMNGYRTIGLFGVELAYGSPRERTVEWASVSWWIGYATALGVEIVKPEGNACALAPRLGRHPRLYGIEYDEEIVDTEGYLEVIPLIHAAMDG